MVDLVGSEEESEEASFSGFAEEESGLVTGERLTGGGTALALTNGEGDPMKRRKQKVRRKRERSEVRRSPADQLLAQAEQARDADLEEKEEKKRRKRKGDGPSGVEALVKLLTQEAGRRHKEKDVVKKEVKEKKKEKKGRKKRKGKKGHGDGSGPGSSGDSSGSGGTSRSEEEEAESSSSEMLAPLQKRSAKKPGAVLKMLVDHARAVMDQTALVSTGAAGVTTGVKLASYWRPREIRRLLGEPLSGDPYRSERRYMEVGTIPGDEPAGGCSRRAYGASPGGAQARQDGGEEPRSRRVGQAQRRRRALETGPKQQRRWKRRKDRKGKGQQQRRPKRGDLEQGRKVVAEPVEEELVGRQQGEGRWIRKRQAGEARRGSCEVGDAGTGRASLASDLQLESFNGLKMVVAEGYSLCRIGCILAWLVVHAVPGGEAAEQWNVFQWLTAQGGAGRSAVHRTPKRESFPLRLGELDRVVDALGDSALLDVIEKTFSDRWCEDCWVFLSVMFCNHLHGRRGVPQGRWRRGDLTAISTLRSSVQRVLRLDTPVPRSPEVVEKELSARFVSYTGEEVARMEPLCLERVLPALPPVGHGGSIPVVNWVKGRTRLFLLRPELCVLKDEGQKLPKLQAKVHIEDKDKLGIALALVERGVCDWVEESEVYTYRNERILNGLFGVAKSGVLYLSVVLDSGETLRLFQSDMTSAFYLFSLPP